ncbi:MAG: hypothetical protein SNJ57_00870 [Cyanobacteriota bacterium]
MTQHQTLVSSVKPSVKPSVKQAVAVYLAEFAYLDTTELADELLIQSESAERARRFAQEYAAHWGIELFSITPATKQQVRLYRLLGRSVLLNAA